MVQQGRVGMVGVQEGVQGVQGVQGVHLHPTQQLLSFQLVQILANKLENREEASINGEWLLTSPGSPLYR